MFMISLIKAKTLMSLMSIVWLDHHVSLDELQECR